MFEVSAGWFGVGKKPTTKINKYEPRKPKRGIRVGEDFLNQ